jgi:hypothetical protein
VDPAVGYAVVAVATVAIYWVVAHLTPGISAGVTHAPELFVHIETDPTLVYAGAPEAVGASFVMPDDSVVSMPPPPGSCRQWRTWLWPEGAYDGGTTDVRVALRGNSDTTVLIAGLLIHLVERTDPVGHAVQCPVGGVGIMTRSLRADLDLEPCVVSYRDHRGNVAKPFAFTLSRGEVEVFHITAATADRCQWTAELHMIVNGERRTAYLDDDGEPFRTSGIAGLPTSRWSVGQQAWMDADPEG